MATQSNVYKNETEMANGNGQEQMAIGDRVIPHVNEPTTYIILAMQPREDNASDPLQWTGG